MKAIVKQLTWQLNVISSTYKIKRNNGNSLVYLLRTPEGFINRTDFLADVGKPVQLVLYQHLMDGIFQGTGTYYMGPMSTYS